MKHIRIVIMLIALTGILAACGDDESATNKEVEVQPVAVETVNVKEGNIKIEKSVYGRTAPTQVSPVLLPAAGEIDDVKVSNGDNVKKDDVIAKVTTSMGEQTLKAPRKGEVMQLTVKAGDMVTEDKPLAVVANTETFDINLSVTDKVRRLFNKKDDLKVMIDGEELEGKVSSIDGMPDDSGLYPVVVEVDNEDDIILSGMLATVYVMEERLKDELILPTEAIVEEADGAFVYVVEDDHVIKKAITINASQSDKTAFEGDVAIDDDVVINGQLTLSDGSLVNVVDDKEAEEEKNNDKGKKKKDKKDNKDNEETKDNNNTSNENNDEEEGE